jgi:5'(3')-deoxyribonucleotidase
MGGANEKERADFLYVFVNNKYPTTEWRFGGLLGGGGKYRSYNAVTCYSESETPERLDLIKNINLALNRLLNKKIVYIDLDGVLADYESRKIVTTERERNGKGFFESLEPIIYAAWAFKVLNEYFDVYILSTAPWSNIHSWTEKRVWVDKHLGELAYKKLILSHNKGLLKGHFIIDDRTVNGVSEFEGEHIHFGSEKFPDWETIVKYLIKK